MKSFFSALVAFLALLRVSVWAQCCDFGYPSGTQCRGLREKLVYCCPSGRTCKVGTGGCFGYWNAPPCDNFPPTDDSGMGGGGLCFSTDATVSVKGKGVVPIMDVRLNDEVISNAGGSYSRVYAFGNRNGDRTATFTRIETTTGSVDLTPDHMLYVVGKSKPVTASSVKVGDTLQTVTMGTNNTVSQRAVVRNVANDVIKSTGFITPITLSGSIAVNGVVASTYSGKHGSAWYLEGGAFSLHYHDVSHVAVAPLRFVCSKISTSFCSSAYHHHEDSQTHAGQHSFFATVHSLKHFAKSDACGSLLHAILFAVVIGAGLLCFFLERTTLVVALAAFAAATTRKLYNQNKKKCFKLA